MRAVSIRPFVACCFFLALWTLAGATFASADSPKRQNLTVRVPAKAVVQEIAGTLKIDSTQPISVTVQTGIDSRNWSVRSSPDASSHVISLKTQASCERLVVTIAAP